MNLFNPRLQSGVLKFRASTLLIRNRAFDERSQIRTGQ